MELVEYLSSVDNEALCRIDKIIGEQVIGRRTCKRHLDIHCALGRSLTAIGGCLAQIQRGNKKKGYSLTPDLYDRAFKDFYASELLNGLNFLKDTSLNGKKIKQVSLFSCSYSMHTKNEGFPNLSIFSFALLTVAYPHLISDQFATLWERDKFIFLAETDYKILLNAHQVLGLINNTSPLPIDDITKENTSTKNSHYKKISVHFPLNPSISKFKTFFKNFSHKPLKDEAEKLTLTCYRNLRTKPNILLQSKLSITSPIGDHTGYMFNHFSYINEGRSGAPVSRYSGGKVIPFDNYYALVGGQGAHDIDINNRPLFDCCEVIIFKTVNLNGHCFPALILTLSPSLGPFVSSAVIRASFDEKKVDSHTLDTTLAISELQNKIQKNINTEFHYAKKYFDDDKFDLILQRLKLNMDSVGNLDIPSQSDYAKNMVAMIHKHCSNTSVFENAKISEFFCQNGINPLMNKSQLIEKLKEMNTTPSEYNSDTSISNYLDLFREYLRFDGLSLY